MTLNPGLRSEAGNKTQLWLERNDRRLNPSRVPDQSTVGPLFPATPRYPGWEMGRGVGGGRLVVAACLLLTLLITGCSESASDAQKPNSGDDVGELAPGASRDKDSADSADTAGPVVTAHAVITTDLGKFTIELYGEDAPNGVENFIGLVREGYYDSLRFHRVVEDFVVQTGDSLTRDSAAREIWGTGGRSFFGKPFESELDPESPTGRLGYSAGTVAMAGDGGNNLSQFFIVLTDKAGLQLPYRHTIIGRVVEGMETVRKIEATGRTTFESPDGEGIEEGFVQVPPVPAMIREVEVNNSKLTIKN